MTETCGNGEGNNILLQSNYEILHFSNEKYALGWGHSDIDGLGKVSTHTGSATLYLATMILLPEKNLGIAVVLNIGDDDESELAMKKVRNHLIRAYSD